ncbi:alpha/beta fold hydrolase [Zavarzinia aquatilis]|uniref:alpha/beta fold hydrolase n=1 Tax=Zavarzinia aquatilis TaxID=2211142 RepID=UPI001401D701|nr:alpha/beta fold hydrolase [Zavarzinia aquatilis]
MTGLGPGQGPARLDEGEGFTAADGTRLPVTIWRPPAGAPVRAVILALHGFNDYAHAFALPAPFWASRGIATYAYDQRGFGRSATARLWPGEDALVADAGAMVRLVARRHPGVPLYLMGESMGGAVAMRALGRDPGLPVAGSILLAPAVWRAEDIPFPGAFLLETMAFLMPWNPMTPPEGLRITPTDNRDEMAAMSRDPLMIKGTRTDAVLGLVRLMQAAAETGVPRDRSVLLLYGLRDEVVRFPAIAALTARARRDNPRYRENWYDRGYHLLLRDRQGPRVWRDIAAFVLDPDAPMPGDALNRP